MILIDYAKYCQFYEEHAENFRSCPKSNDECVECPYYKWIEARWIPVTESLPPYRKNVAVLTKMKVAHVAKLVNMGGVNVWVGSMAVQYGENIITHYSDSIPAIIK